MRIWIVRKRNPYGKAFFEAGNVRMFILLEEIKEMDNWDVSRINKKKEVLACSFTELVHGKEEANKAKAAA